MTIVMQSGQEFSLPAFEAYLFAGGLESLLGGTDLPEFEPESITDEESD